jgi:hypothetical protein
MKKIIFITIVCLTILVGTLAIFKPEALSIFSLNSSIESLFDRINFRRSNSDSGFKQVKNYNPTENLHKDAKAPSFSDENQIVARECAFENNNNNTITSILIYVSDDRLRADSMISNDAGDILKKTHIISNGQFVYTWEDQSKIGIMYEETKPSEAGYINPFQAVDIDALKKYVVLDANCESVTVNEKIYGIPKDIEFREITLDLDKLNSVGKETFCNLCNDAPDQNLQDDCKKAFACE